MAAVARRVAVGSDDWATLTSRGAVDMFVPSHYTAGVLHPRSMIMTNTLLAT